MIYLKQLYETSKNKVSEFGMRNLCHPCDCPFRVRCDRSDPIGYFVLSAWRVMTLRHTVKLARAKLSANAGNFTCSSQAKRSLAQFTCVTCSLPVITGKFTCFEAASTSRRTHAHCLRAHVNLPEYHRYFTGSFTCGTHANLPATSRQKYMQLTGKNTRIAGKNTRQTQAKITAIARKNTRTIAGKKPAIPRRITCNCRQSAITPWVNSPANCT